MTDFRSAAFGLCRWAKGKPRDVRWNVLIPVMKLRLLAHCDNPAEQENVLCALSRLQT